MKQKLAVLPFFLAAFLVLVVSIVKTASVKYAFSQAPSPSPENSIESTINYDLPEVNLTPEDPLWPVQALIDMGETHPEAYLENADVRLVAGGRMFDEGKIEEGVLVLQKGEQYLSQSLEAASALPGSEEREELMYEISLASLKHREILETILLRVPEDGRATVARIIDIPKNVYDSSASELTNAGLGAPEYPF